MASRGRFISLREFIALLVELRFFPSISESELEFLERQRLVAPVARVFYPPSIVIESHGFTPNPVPTEVERNDAQALLDALDLWSSPGADPEQIHPFDISEGGSGASLIMTDVASKQFVNWDDFRVNVRGPGQDPLYINGVDTFYHDWQILLVADALEMGVRLNFDFRRTDFSKPGLRWLQDILAEKNSHIMWFSNASLFEDGLKWARWFDAVAKLEVVRSRKLATLAGGRRLKAFTLEESQFVELNDVLKRSAERELGAIGATGDELISFLTYLCWRWRTSKSQVRDAVAGEYKRQIGLTIRMARHAFDMDVKSLALEVGGNNLEHVFPEWEDNARNMAELSLKRSIIAKAPFADAALTLDDAAVIDLLDWLEQKDLWKVHLTIKKIIRHQFRATPIDRSALAKEVESLSTTFEHVLNALLNEAAISPSRTLMKKVRALWSNTPDVKQILDKLTSLVNSSQTSRADRLAEIWNLSLSGANEGVARTLLAAVLYRNDGQHNGMASWAEEELHEATRVLLTAMLFCRRNLLVRLSRS